MCAKIQRWILITATFFMVTATLVLPAQATTHDPTHGLLILAEDGPEPAPVLGQMIHVQVTGVVARATVTQSFTNPTDRHVEALYVFPLPEKAAVDELRIRIGERVIQGEIKEKQEAQEIYQAAAEDGRKAVLLEQQRPNVFTASVTQIGPGESIDVEIEMQFDVDYDLGTFRLRFPMVVAPRYEPSHAAALLQPFISPPSGEPPVAGEEVNPTALRVDVETGFPVAEVIGGLHEILVWKHGERGFSVELAEEIVPAAGDFVLEWSPKLGREPRVTSLVQEVDGERYVLVMVIPPVPEALGSQRLPREAVFVVDVSGSMEGGKLKQARQALLMGLAQLKIGDRFNVISFSDDLDALFDTSRDVDPTTLAEGRRYVSALTIRGGTSILPAVARALEDPDPESTMLRQVVFVTDGQASDEERIFSEIQARLERSRLFTVGIGAAPNSHFMRRAAELGRGTFTYVDSLDHVKERMSNLLRKLDAPVIQDIRVVWDDPAAEAWPRRVGDLYLGEPLVLGARVTAGSGVTVSGWQRGKHMEVVLPLKGSVRASGLDKLWARRKISALDNERIAGADPEEVRARIVDLGLRHHLVTDFTSLVSVDDLPTAPVGEAPVRHMMAVNNSVAVSSYTSGDVVEELITVTSESPLLDPSKITTGTTVTPIELEKIPSARDPWAAVAATPGVVTDRVNVGSNEAALPETLLSPGSTADENVWSVDGVVITDMRSISGNSPSYYNFDEYEEVTVTTGGADVTKAHAGVTVDVITRRGINEMQLRSHYLGTGGAEEPPQPAPGRDRIEEAGDYGASAGGPAVPDQLWIWGTYSRRDAERTAIDGDPGAALFEGGSARLNAQLGSSRSAVVSWNRGDVTNQDLDASPERSPEAALDVVEQAEMFSALANLVFSSDFYMEASLASSRRDASMSTDGSAPALWADDGVLYGSGRSGEDRSESWQAGLAGSSFFDLGGASHELTYGGERRDVERTGFGHWEEGILSVDGANLGVPGADFFRLESTGATAADRVLDSLWLQDVWTWNRWVLTTGLRYDRQHGELVSATAESVDWRTLVPRLGLSIPIGADRRTLIRASWSRFAQQLGYDLVVRPDPSAHGEALFRASGEDGVLLDADGLFRPHRNDPELEAALTDELFVGVEQEIGYTAALSLHLVHRTRSRVHELRDLVVDEASGEVRAAERSDYVQDHFVTGTLPDGSAYSVPVYSLGPGVSDAGASLLTNGDRELEYDGVSIRFDKRFDGFWMARVGVHYGEQKWRLGPGWRRHHDPTDLVGSGDDDGALYVEPPGDVDLRTRPWVQSTWSAYLTGLVRLFPESRWGFDLAASVHARQGNPLPYFVWDLASADALPRRVQVSEDIDSFRAADWLTFDLRLEKEVRLVRQLSSVWSFDVLNLFDEGAVQRRELNLSGARGGFFEETVASRVFRLGVRLSWN